MKRLTTFLDVGSMTKLGVKLHLIILFATPDPEVYLQTTEDPEVKIIIMDRIALE
jgi:hypothetical protein